jgi:hypothetical protein
MRDRYVTRVSFLTFDEYSLKHRVLIVLKYGSRISRDKYSIISWREECTF